jgi:hypothetical protein
VAITEASRERWTVRLAFAALFISLVALGVTYLQWRSAERAADIADHARIDANKASSEALAVAERARVDAVNLAERQRADAQMTLSAQRRDAATALEAQTERADRANALADRSAKAAEDTAKTAALQVEVTERPWIKVKATLITPLTFNTPVQVGEVASAKVQLLLENTGKTVALNVLSWSDILPLDPSGGYRAALKRRSEWCDANRHPNPQGLAGYYVFPNDPFVEVQTVGPPMNLVFQAVSQNTGGMKGKVGFVLVGCVSYRAPLQTEDQSRHETRFLYYLGNPDPAGLLVPFVEPSGIANLQLVAIPDGFSAD